MYKTVLNEYIDYFWYMLGGFEPKGHSHVPCSQDPDLSVSNEYDSSLGSPVAAMAFLLVIAPCITIRIILVSNMEVQDPPA